MCGCATGAADACAGVTETTAAASTAIAIAHLRFLVPIVRPLCRSAAARSSPERVNYTRIT